jgi:UDP-glucose-4-epimerase GalE
MTSPGAVLVTGGAGYIGSHTVRALRSDSRQVVVLDSLELGDRDAVIDAPLVVGDVSNRDLVIDVCREHGVTQVIHFAAYKAVGESMAEPLRYWENNVAGSARLFDAAAAAGVREVVFSSSCSVYGNPTAMPVAESESIEPESVYAETKATVERILSWYEQTHGVRSVSLRYFNAAGASADARIGENWDYSSNLIPLVMKALLVPDQPIEVFGDDYDTPDGTCIRDYIHVEDLTDAHVRALDYLDRGGVSTALNVGTGRGSSVLEVIAAAERAAGRPVPHTIGPRRAGDPAATYADPTASRAALGWSAQHDLDHIVETALRWHEQARFPSA